MRDESCGCDLRAFRREHCDLSHSLPSYPTYAPDFWACALEGRSDGSRNVMVVLEISKGEGLAQDSISLKSVRNLADSFCGSRSPCIHIGCFAIILVMLLGVARLDNR